jgi:hypothetical protein
MVIRDEEANSRGTRERDYVWAQRRDPRDTELSGGDTLLFCDRQKLRHEFQIVRHVVFAEASHLRAKVSSCKIRQWEQFKGHDSLFAYRVCPHGWRTFQ